MTSTQTIIPGYSNLQLLHDSQRTIVYRGLQNESQQPVVIKLLKPEYPTFNELVNFRNQYVIALNLDLPGVVRPLALENYGNGFALVMDDFGGISLSDYIDKQSLSLEEFFRVAIALCRILEGLYRDRVIHKDIKPANILIHSETLEIKLIDFSISSLLPKETQVLQNPGILEGTLAYMSPEQTGRMNRGIDYRSDFYSLGVTFYQLLTGQLPFPSSDPMELVHCHIARTPTPPHEVKPDIPQMLSSMVMKLMAKTAEDRYQTARGLRHDLEICNSQWMETGSIDPFELATRDISESFIIPEKLYGRSQEVETLLAAFDRVADGKSEMMLVAGFSGIGKTAVVNEVHKPIVRQRGYFIKGKFDQFQRNIPFSAFVQAFRDLMGQLLGEDDAKLQEWKSKILEALGQNGQVIIDVIPELEHIIGPQPTLPELSGSGAQNRFNMLFEKFIGVFATSAHPLVIFLDDLQWADSASLKLLQLLMSETPTGYLLLLGAYRDNEVFPAHPLMLTLDEIGKTRATLNKITLAPLSQVDLNQLIADTFICTKELALPLTDLLYQKTKGNPFFATQFLKGLQEDGLIGFNEDVGHWECDLARVRQLALTDDVVEFMALQLRKLPTLTQSVLKLAACIGNQFDLETLAVVCEQSVTKVATDLWGALQEGLVLPKSEMYKFFQGVDESEREQSEEVSVGYNFLHDRVQQAAYSLIPDSQKKSTHLQIGQLLLSHRTQAEREENIFDIVNQLNYGVELIADAASRSQLAQLNLIAGQKAKSATAYGAAGEYLAIGMGLLASSSWQKQYHMTLALYQEAAEVAYLSTDFERMEGLVETVLQRASNLLDKVKVYEVKMQACMAQNQLIECLQIALPVLKELGVQLPESPQFSEIEEGLAEATSLLAGKQLSELIDLPLMSAPDKLAAMMLLSKVVPAAFTAVPQLLPLVVFQQVNLSVKYGNASQSPFAYANYGQILGGVAGDLERAYEFGQLAVSLLSRVNARELKAKTYVIVNFCIRHWREHLRETLKPFQEAYTSGLETGDVEYGAYAAINYGIHSYFSGGELAQLSQEMSGYSTQLRKLKQETALNYHEIFRQAVLNLLGCAENPCLLRGEAYDEVTMLPRHYSGNDRLAIAHVSLNKLILCYLFGEYPQAVENAAIAFEYLDMATAFVGIPLLHFYDSLAQMATYPAASAKQQPIARVTSNQEKMHKWAQNAPMNHLHKFDLVEAERHRVLEENVTAMEMYDRAIAGAKENGYVQEEALGNELAGKFYLDWGKEKIARTYMIDAYYCYARWGAKAKVEYLEERYGSLLAPILKQNTTSFTPGSAVTLTSGTVTSSTTSAENLLDLYSALKASQAISGEIKLEQLLKVLMQVIIENAGASKAALLLPKAEGLAIEAIASYDAEDSGIQVTSVAQSLSVAEREDIPQLVINRIWRTRETLVLNDVPADTRFAGDSYLHRCQPKSLLCAPLFNQGKLIAILYLENQLVTGAFTSSRISILNLLTVQAAISLENARLYQQSLDYAQQLEQAQLQLVQSEKMATVGQLTAGVAHEINNPVSFISGNLSHASEYIRDLIDLLQLYQKEISLPSATIQDKIAEIELDYLIEDLPQLIESMNEGTDRITEISKSMRTFSRSDTVAKVAFNLHEGLDSTLLILTHRLKANQNRPAIQVVKNYGDLPEVQCYPGQLNQVFMNIIANAIDAFEESNQGKTFAEIKKHPNQITITTELTSLQDTVIVRIRDNGMGIPAEVKAKIFDNLFTTKPVGKGTGLGLAISQQIVAEKHGGKLTCTSQVGEGTEFAIALPLGA
ncbi:MAG: AAA family ATPase [Hormoscilla sp.]